MRKFFLFLFSLFIGISLFSWTIEIVGWQEIKKAFLVFTGWQGLAILALTFLGVVIGTWKWREILRAEGVTISSRELFGAYLAGFSIMFLTPILLWGGEMFRSYVLKEKHSVPWSKSMASVIIDRILEYTCNLAVIFLGALFFLLFIGIPSPELIIISVGVFVIFFAALAIFYFKCLKKESFVAIFSKNNQNQPHEIEKEIFRFFKIKKISMWKSFALAFLRTAAMYLRAWLLLLFLGKNLSALPVLSVLGFTYLALLIPIPTALGAHEALQTFAFGALGLGASSATAFTMIIRGAELILSFFGVAMLCRLGLKLLEITLFRKMEEFTNKNGGS